MTYHDLTPGIYFEHCDDPGDIYRGITQVLEVGHSSICFTDIACFTNHNYSLAFEEWYAFENLDHLLYEPLTTSDLTLDQLRSIYPEHFI